MDVLNPLDDAAFTAKTTTYTGTAGTVTAWPPGASAVLVWCTTSSYVKVGVGVTATTASTPLPANTVAVFKVDSKTGEPWVVSAIQIAAGGSVYAKPLIGGSA